MVSNVRSSLDQSKKDPCLMLLNAPLSQSRCGLQYLRARPIQCQQIQTYIQYLQCALNSAITSLLDDHKHASDLD
jgi:hypothetical protein